jgi:rhodanese-related sulfurtransferase
MSTTHIECEPILQPAQLAALLRQHATIRLLDVRTPGEFASLHVRGSYNVPLDTLGEHGREIGENVTDPVVLVCQSGRRARQAEEALKSTGLRSVHVLDGGLAAWLAAGLPVVRGRGRISLERQVRIVAGAIAATGGLLAIFVNPMLGVVSVVVGGGLVFAGLTDTCAMAMLLAKLPYNRPASCDVEAMVRALADGRAAASPAG